MPTVAITNEFLDAFERMPRKVQRKARAFMDKFRSNPEASAINYEKIDAEDKKVRTVRIGLDYRGIVLHPETSDVYVLVYVDHHDEAMRWARNKRFDIHPRTGALQVVDLEHIKPATPDKSPASKSRNAAKTLFIANSEEQLFDLGVPKVLLPAVKGLKTEEELDQLVAFLPAEASEALYGLASGIPFEEVQGQVERRLVAEDDLAKALEHPDTKRRVAIVTDDEALQAMLNAPLDKWRVFLHPSQRKLVEGDYSGDFKVTGGAGTGKTVVAMHRAVFLAKYVFKEPDDRILFTTFTKNLALNIRQNLEQLDEDAAKRISVTSIDSQAHAILKQNGISFTPLSDTADEIAYRWQEAIQKSDLELPTQEWRFFQDELQDVVFAYGISTEDDYLAARRTGRKGRLSRGQRPAVWRVIEEFLNICEDTRKLPFNMIVSKATACLLNKHALPYSAVVVDETQDLSSTHLRFIRAMVEQKPNALFIVGDAHQRIYGKPVVLSKCGINVRGRARRLKINYRTTKQISIWSQGLLEGLSFDDLDGDREEQKGYISLMQGRSPQTAKGENLKEQAEVAAAHIKELLASGVGAKGICIAMGTKDAVARMSHELGAKHGIKTVELDRSKVDPRDDLVRVSTMHRIKGLEFPQMIVCGIAKPGKISEEEKEDSRARSLLYVAATRARDGLLVIHR